VTPPTGEAWDAELRPHRTPPFVYAAAFLIAAAHIAVGVLLKIKSSGVIFQTADQVAIALLGLVIAGVADSVSQPVRNVGFRPFDVGAQLRGLSRELIAHLAELGLCPAPLALPHRKGGST